MENWCKRCVYADKDGADDPCFECEWGNDEAPTRFTAKRKKLTNADKYFRNATDEELAHLIAGDWCELVNCPILACDGQCEDQVLAWLKEEVQDEE